MASPGLAMGTDPTSQSSGQCWVEPCLDLGGEEE
jgi:hypothetical protein